MSDKPLISFDYAIKYLLKNKGGYDIVEGFISALLASSGYPPVKIAAILDCESLKEGLEVKKSIADLVVEDKDGNKYIVEIERSFSSNFIHKACFNSSRLIVDSISENQDYREIKKVFHISLLYFNVNKMEKPIYHGKTIIHEIDTSQPINLRLANLGLVFFETPNVLPEYFFISIPRFADVINEEIDEWLYVMKHSDAPPNFKSPYMKRVLERLAVLKMDAGERAEYFQYLKEAVYSEDVIEAAEAKGEARGKAEGKAEKTLEIAKNLLKAGISGVLISSSTGLSLEEIEKLKK